MRLCLLFRAMRWPLFATLFLVTGAVFAASGDETARAGSAVAPTAIVASDIEDYRTQVEFRCRDAAAARGELREQVALSCGCLVEQLRDNVTEEIWANAVRAARAGDGGAGQRMLSPHVGEAVAACRALPAKELSRIQAQYGLWPMLHGTWTRTLADGCVERYAFREDGGVVLVRGGNVMEQAWTILPEQPSSSRVHVATRIGSNNGGTDCSGRGRREASGQQGDIWVFIDYANTRLYNCASREGRDCVGPYRMIPGS